MLFLILATVKKEEFVLQSKSGRLDLKKFLVKIKIADYAVPAMMLS